MSGCTFGLIGSVAGITKMRAPFDAHLVLVEPDRREPVVPQQLRGELALDLREHVHVAVVVVADVLLVEPRHRRRLELGAEVLVVPVDHHDLAVGVEARHEQEDHVVEDVLHARRRVGGQPVDQLERHLRRADLGRVDAARDERRPPCPTGRSRRAARRSARRPGSRAGAAGRGSSRGASASPADAISSDDERVALGRLAQLAHAHAVRCLLDEPEVLDDLVPARQLRVGADAEPEELLGRRDGCLRRSRGRRGQRAGGEEARGRERRPARTVLRASACPFRVRRALQGAAVPGTIADFGDGRRSALSYGA